MKALKTISPFEINIVSRLTFKKIAFGFVILWSLIAILSFAQDYLSSFLNNGPFYTSEAVLFNLYWLLFIPFSILWIYGLNRLNYQKKNRHLYLILFSLPIILSAAHLLLFALILHILSAFIHQDPYQFEWLVKQKFSDYLYPALSVYILIAFTGTWINRKQEKKASGNNFSSLIPVKIGRKSLIIDVNDIRWISSEGSYVLVHTDNRKYVVSSSLKGLLNKLNPEKFRRIHRSTIVNLGKVKELKSRLNGDYDVIMKEGTQLRLSRNYSKNVKGQLL